MTVSSLFLKSAMADCLLLSEARRVGCWGMTTGGTQASVEPTFSAEIAMLWKDPSSAESVIYNDRKRPGDCLRKLTCINDTL